MTAPPAFAGHSAPVVWMTTRAEHFVVHYPSTPRTYAGSRVISTAKLARRTATTADRLYDGLAAMTDLSDLPQPIHIIIDGHLVSSDRAYAEPEWARIHIPSAPGPEFLAGGQGDWLTQTLAHELGHLVLAYAEAAVSPGLAGLIEARVGTPTVGGGNESGVAASSRPYWEGALRLPITDAAPFFWVEGGAEFLADLAGANRFGPARDMLLRTAVLEHLILSPAALQSSLGKTGMDGDRAYNQGYAFMLFLRERYGEASFARIVAAARHRFRWQWTDAIEDGQGIAFDELYARWIEWLEQRYAPDDSGTLPVVEGEPLVLVTPPWRSPDLEVRRRWMAKPLAERRADRERHGLVAAYPTWSPDGAYLATWEDGLRVQAIDELSWSAFGGRPLQPGRDRLELNRRRRRRATLEGVLQYPMSWAPNGKRLVVVAPEHWNPGVEMPADPAEWRALFLVDVVEHQDKSISLTVVPPRTPIAGTLGARDPAWSPDNNWIAFVRYSDGTANLWVVHPDGTDPRPLTRFADGAMIAHPAWSPDSKRVVFELFRKGQRDLWTAHVSRDELLPVMLDDADDRHPCWGYDGKIYYASDGTGVFNLYSFDPSTLEVRQLTRVTGGAFMPWVSRRDNITYVNFDGYAYRVYGLPVSSRLEEPVDNAAFFVDATLARGLLQDAQEAPSAQGERYRALRGFSRTMVIPGLRVTDRLLEAGFRFRWQDPLDRHDLMVETTAGTGSTLHARYAFSRFVPRFQAGVWQRSVKESVAVDLTPDDQFTPVDTRREQRYREAYLAFDVALSSRLSLGLTADATELGYRTAGGPFQPSPLYRSVGGGPRLTYAAFRRGGKHGPRGIDPRGFLVSLDYAVRGSRVWDPLTGGLLADAGDWLGAYTFRRLDATLFAGWRIPVVHHTFEWRFDLGSINRNVAWWDELKAGTSLAMTVPPAVSFVPFPGYGVGSLSGETLAVLAAAYRFPLAQDISRTVGPIYFDSLYAQFEGTAGNVWSYRPSPGGAIREDPAQDVASRNSTPDSETRVVYELGVQLRAGASIFARYRWDSFVRFGYAFVPVTGLGDINHDRVYPGTNGDLVPQAGGEVYPAGVRLSLGIGTGF